MIDETTGVDIARIEAAVREILLAIGEDPERDGLQRTPATRRGNVRRESSAVCTKTRRGT